MSRGRRPYASVEYGQLMSIVWYDKVRSGVPYGVSELENFFWMFAPRVERDVCINNIHQLSVAAIRQKQWMMKELNSDVLLFSSCKTHSNTIKYQDNAMNLRRTFAQELFGANLEKEQNRGR